MRVLLAIVVLAALAWSGFWYWNASARDRALTNWLEERRAAGWIAEGDVRVTGFPNRVDVIVDGLALADPKAGWSWSAPEFQLLSQSYRPQHLIAVWPGEQTIATPYETVRVTSERLVGSVVVEPNRLVGLDHTTLEMKGVTLAGATGWNAGIGDALFSIRKTPNAAAANSYDLDFAANELRLPDSWIVGIDRAGVLPPAIETTHLAATATFDRPWDRAAIEGDNPALRALEISDARFAWGQLDLRAAGTLRPDARGFAEGTLDLTARNWRGMLEAAEQSGALNPTLAGTLRGALGLFARLAGDGDTLRLPLEFRDGETRLGPVTIGAAPVLTRRP